MTAPDTTTPTTAQLAAAFAQALLPLAGPKGLAVSAIMSAGLQFLAEIQSTAHAAGTAVWTMEDLEKSAQAATDALAEYHSKADPSGAAHAPNALG